MKTVLFVLHSADYYSGATRSMTDIIIRLHTEKKINALVLLPDSEGSAIELLTNNGIKTIHFPYKSLMQDERSPLWKRVLKIPVYVMRLLYHFKAARIIANEVNDADIIYSNTSTIILGALVAKIAKKPHIWHFREFRQEDHRIHFFLGEKWHMKFASRHADIYIMISQSMVEKHKYCLPENRIRLIYNELPEKYILSRECYNVNDTLSVLIAGDVKPGKGQLEVVEAVGRLRQKGTSVALNIAGKCSDNEYLQRIRDIINNYNITDSVIFHGMVKDMNSLRKRMDVGIVASCQEAFGRVTVEGMLGRLCMVGCNSGGTKELITDGLTGLLYEPGDIEGLVACLEKLNADRSYLSELAENSFDYAKSRFTNGACSNEVYRIIEEI